MSLLSSIAAAADVPNDHGVMRFDFTHGTHPSDQKWTDVADDAVYTDATGLGYEPAARVEAKPYRFSVRVSEGNYRVTLKLGDAKADSVTTVKSETRRLELERVAVPAGKTETRSFTVNIRRPKIAGGGEVKTSAREADLLHWDDKLTLEFLGDHPAVANLTLERDDKAKTIFIAGDSTVCDQPGEPWAGWGQVLPRFVKYDIAVANYAESGRALSSFEAERRLAKLLSVAKAGDFLLIQFGHNDMKEKFAGAGAYGNYTENYKRYIAAARAKGMTPVVITSMQRRRFNTEGKIENTFGDYIDAARKVAADEKVTLIDLNAMSTAFYETMGPEGSKAAFVHYPAGTFPDHPEQLKDDTHHNMYGAYELARCVIDGMLKESSLAALLNEDAKEFDPAKPDAPASVAVPPSLPTTRATSKPAGS